MPELPEVETMRRGILPVVGGKVIGCQFPRSRCKPIALQPGSATFRRRILGQQITQIGRRGKRVLVELGSRDTIVFEPRMTGLVLLTDPPSQAHLRVVISLRDCCATQLMFWDRRGLGSVRILNPRQRAEAVDTRLGPDALDVTVEGLMARFAGCRCPIKVALLDQVRLAGIGNLYASEILFVAGTHPTTSCAEISRVRWQRIHAAMRHVLEEAIKYEGSTLADGTYRTALNKTGRYQNHHRVYQRAAEMCQECERSTIQRLVQAQRSTFFCPRCQPLYSRR